MPLSPSFPQLASLDLFVSVVALGSLSRAAELHGITQPSASGRIRRLERQLDLQLLDRSHSGSTPTPVGVLVAGWAEAILQTARELQAGLRAVRTEGSGQMQIAASFTIAEFLLPQCLERFTRTHPSDAITLHVTNSANVIERVRSGQADLGFIETPTPTPDLGERRIAEDDLVTVVAPSHEWAGSRRVGVEILAATPLVTREPGSGTREALEAALRTLRLAHPPAVLELGSTAAVLAAVKGGNAPTVISRLAVTSEVARGSLVEIDVQGLRIVRELRAIWRGRSQLSALSKDLLSDLIGARGA